MGQALGNFIDDLLEVATSVQKLGLNWATVQGDPIEIDVKKTLMDKMAGKPVELIYKQDLGFVDGYMDIDVLIRQLQKKLLNEINDIFVNNKISKPEYLGRIMTAIQFFVNNVNTVNGVFDKKTLNEINNKIEKILPLINANKEEQKVKNFHVGTNRLDGINTQTQTTKQIGEKRKRQDQETR